MTSRQRQMAYSIMESSDPEYIESVDFYMEGANLDARKILKKTRKELRILTKQIKANLKQGDYRSVKEKTNKVRKLAKDGIKELDKIQDTSAGIPSFVLSFFTSFTVDIGRTMVTLLTTLIPIAGPFIALTRSLEAYVKECDEIKRNISRKDWDFVRSDSNSYINRCKLCIRRYLAIMNKFDNMVSKIEKETRTLKKESYDEDYDDYDMFGEAFDEDEDFDYDSFFESEDSGWGGF